MIDFNSFLLLTIGPLMLLTILVFVWLTSNTVTRQWNRHKTATVSRWQAEEVEFVRGPAGGQFGGLASASGYKVMRGIGFMAITTQDLRLTRAMPSAEWHIPFNQIEQVAIQPVYLDKKGKTPFIVIDFVKDGVRDRVGFQVNNSEAWATDIAEAAGVELQDKR